MTLVKNIPLQFSKKEILRYLGYKAKKSEKSEAVDALLDKAIDLAKTLVVPAAVFETLFVERVYGGRVEFKDSRFFLEGENISKYFSACSRVTLLGATIGGEIDEEISRLFEAGNSSLAVVLDAAGSDAVEEVVTWVNTLIDSTAAAQGYSTLPRVSPGYGLWRIEANAAIAGFLNLAEKTGIDVLPSFELVPRKSVIAAIGWVPKKEIF